MSYMNIPDYPTDDESPIVTFKEWKESKKQYKKLLALRNKAIKRAVKKKK